ncbi:transcriptional regulator FtsR [Enemella sp. A6]|uniref:transcriptional regulator FtsR n=1 Tax=Enemella sp. A6 TaxID=3440152 RepID=UPI003EBD72D6
MASEVRRIGQVLAILKKDFADISISKIRFLESEGLLTPERAPSGYRLYSEDDIARLRYILRMQRDHYLPHKVIREHLDMMDRGLTPPAVNQPAPGPQAVSGTPQPRPPQRKEMRLSRGEFLKATGLPEAFLAELERQHIITSRRGSRFYGRDAVTIGLVARRLAEYGMDARHLRAFQLAATREVGLIEQALAPHLRRSGNRKLAAEVVQLAATAHAAMMRQAMDR